MRSQARTEGDTGGLVRLTQVREKYEEVKWWRTNLLPEPLRHDSGHEGSHCFITHEFIDAVLKGRKPAVDVYAAIACTAPGIVGHQSALNGGEQMKIPQFDTA